MTDSEPRALDWRTRLIHATAAELPPFTGLVPPVYRASTLTFARMAEVSEDWRQRTHLTYGVFGTPTVRELGARVAALEGARHSFITPGGLAGITLVNLAFARAGGHVLLPRAAYGPATDQAHGLLTRLGVTVEAYAPGTGAAIAERFRPETALVWCESPGSVTMEVEDVPAIAAAARARGIPVALDNTWAAGLFFDAFRHGVDVSVQALTKYVGGHADLLLGAVSVATEAMYEKVGRTFEMMGMNASPDDCSLALRGMLTMGVRLERLEASTLAVARWLAARPEVEAVRHPALPGAPGHALWQRDFTGSTSVFSIVLRPDWTPARVAAFVDALRLFRIGYSWGGVTSLVMAYPALTRLPQGQGPRLVRFNVGLEAVDDLLADLAQALDAARGP